MDFIKEDGVWKMTLAPTDKPKKKIGVSTPKPKPRPKH